LRELVLVIGSPVRGFSRRVGEGHCRFSWPFDL
jgi:hypothetical protein